MNNNEIDMTSDESDDLDEDEEDLDEQDSEPTRKRGKKLSAKEKAANRAWRIKMGKCGQQAASRKDIKSGKEACQRKLWNQQVSARIQFKFKSVFQNRRMMQS